VEKSGTIQKNKKRQRSHGAHSPRHTEHAVFLCVCTAKKALQKCVGAAQKKQTKRTILINCGSVYVENDQRVRAKDKGRQEKRLLVTGRSCLPAQLGPKLLGGWVLLLFLIMEIIISKEDLTQSGITSQKNKKKKKKKKNGKAPGESY
jgi:hypothetical protein